MNTEKQIYFASDFHLGYPDKIHSKEREARLVEWLEFIKPTCKELYLLGDVFDFWYEYTWVVPKGYIRFLAKLAEFTDSGIPVYMFMGNHDEWLHSYLAEEIGVIIYKDPIERVFNNKKMYIHHGHALGNYDRGMNFLHKVFSNKILQWLFSRVHPNAAFGLAHMWSKKSRKAKVYESNNYMGDDKEWLLLYAQDVLKHTHFDYFIFGHRHLAIQKNITNNSVYINTGNWITNSSYAVFDGNSVEVILFKPEVYPNQAILK